VDLAYFSKKRLWENEVGEAGYHSGPTGKLEFHSAIAFQKSGRKNALSKAFIDKR
jgi:hypothetical protein